MVCPALSSPAPAMQASVTGNFFAPTTTTEAWHSLSNEHNHLHGVVRTSILHPNQASHKGDDSAERKGLALGHNKDSLFSIDKGPGYLGVAVKEGLDAVGADSESDSQHPGGKLSAQPPSTHPAPGTANVVHLRGEGDLLHHRVQRLH